MKTLKLIIVTLLLLNLTACWSKQELDELTFIFGMYVDIGKDPNTVEVTISSPLPNRLMSGSQGTSGAGDGKSYSTVSKTGGTLSEALILIQKDLTRTLKLSHLKIVVVSKQYARQGIGDMLKWFMRQPEIPLGAYIMAAPGRAKDIPNLTPYFEQLPDQVLNNLAKGNYMFSTTIRDCLLAEANRMGYAMNYLSFGEKADSSGQDKKEYWVGIDGVMLFQDNKMRGILNVKESRALAWAAGDIAGQLKIPLYSVKWKENGRGGASMMFLSSSSSTSVKMTPEGPVFYVKLKGRAGLTFFKDSEDRGVVQLTPLIISKIQEKLVKEVSESLKHTQTSEVDVLQLGMLLEWNYPQEWERLREHWEEYYSKEAQIKVTANFIISDYGSEK